MIRKNHFKVEKLLVMIEIVLNVIFMTTINVINVNLTCFYMIIGVYQVVLHIISKQLLKIWEYVLNVLLIVNLVKTKLHLVHHVLVKKFYNLREI
jgi:hypothetical protein